MTPGMHAAHADNVNGFSIGTGFWLAIRVVIVFEFSKIL